jgi:hypothetical protein
MKLNTMIEKEEQLVEHQIRFYLMVNGLIAGSFFVGCAMLLYRIMKAIFE